MALPAISVLIDTYNQGHFLEQAVESVLEQDFPREDVEIVIVDDGSTDNTAALAAKFAPRVKYLRKANGGQISAYNFAVSRTRAPIVAFLDADDWWMKGKLRAVMEAFAAEPDATAVGHGFVTFHDDEGTEELCVPDRVHRLNLSSSRDARFAHAARQYLSTSKLAVRRSVIEAAGLLPQELVFFDVALQVMAMALGLAIVLDQPLAYYRHHGRNLYQSRRPDAENLRRKIQCFDAQLRFFPEMLANLGVAPDCIAAILEPDALDRERMRLDLEGGWPWETFRLELRRFRAYYEKPAPLYAAFKWFALMPALCLPPKRFYAARDWYWRHNLRRFRRIFGEPTPISQINVQKSATYSS